MHCTTLEDACEHLLSGTVTLIFWNPFCPSQLAGTLSWTEATPSPGLLGCSAESTRHHEAGTRDPQRWVPLSPCLFVPIVAVRRRAPVPALSIKWVPLTWRDHEVWVTFLHI